MLHCFLHCYPSLFMVAFVSRVRSRVVSCRGVSLLFRKESSIRHRRQDIEFVLPLSFSPRYCHIISLASVPKPFIKPQWHFFGLVIEGSGEEY